MSIAHQLARDRIGPVPSKMGIWRASVRHGLIKPHAGGNRLVEFKRWERGRRMELWRLDVVGGVLLAAVTEAKELTGVMTTARAADRIRAFSSVCRVGAVVRDCHHRFGFWAAGR